MSREAPGAGADAGAARGSFTLLVALLTGASMLGTAGTGVLPTVAPEVARSYGIPAIWIGYQISVVAFFMLASLVFLSNASRRWGACRVTQAGLAVTGASLAVSLVPHPASILVASIGMGIGYGSVMPAVSHLLMRFTPTERLNFVFSVQQAGIPLGSVIAAAAAPAIAITFGWRWALAAASLGLVALAALMQPWREGWDDDRDPAAPAGRSLRAGLGTVVRDRKLLWMAIAGACFSGIQFCVTTFAVVALVEGLGMGIVQAGLVLTTAQVCGIGSRLACGWIADRTGDALYVLAWLAGSIVVVGLACFPLNAGWPLVAVYLLFAALGAATVGWPGAFFAEIGRLSPAGHVASSTAATLMLTGLGKTLLPIAFAAVYSWTRHYGAAFAMLGAVSAVSLACLIGARRLQMRSRTPGDAPA